MLFWGSYWAWSYYAKEEVTVPEEDRPCRSVIEEAAVGGPTALLGSIDDDVDAEAGDHRSGEGGSWEVGLGVPDVGIGGAHAVGFPDAAESLLSLPTLPLPLGDYSVLAQEQVAENDGH